MIRIMKNNTIMSCLLGFCFTIFLNGQTTAIPDSNFENYLETHAQDGSEVLVGDLDSMGDGIANNGLVLTSRINDVVLLDIGGLGISNLTGIADFIALENLFCSNNNLATLDVSNNINLVSLLCDSNSLQNILVANNTNLETLNCADNQIQTLDVSNNLALKNLTASGNQLSEIDISNNTELSLLGVSNNRITGELVTSNNPNLEGLFCSSNQISTLDLTLNPLLKNLNASDNVLTNIDLSAINSLVCPDPQTDPITACQGSSSIDVSRNQLVSLVVNNGFNDLFSSLNTTENPDLFCIQIDAGFTPNSWIKDDWTYYSEIACVDIYTYVPDDNFEQALIDLGIDTDLDLDNFVLRANIEAITNLNISNASISRLEGIQDFLALEVLNCSTNNLQNLDLSNNLMLLQLDVSNNNLTSLELNSNTDLIDLNCSFNAITFLNLNTNVALATLNVSNNSLTSIEVSGNAMLNVLNVSSNQIESLNLTSNTTITSVLCQDNNLFALNINNGNNAVITVFDATNNNNLFCINVDNVALANAAADWQRDAIATYSLNCGTYVPDDNFEQTLIDLGIDSDGTLNNFVPTTDVNGIPVLDVSNRSIVDLTGIEDFVALIDLNVSNNMLTSLELNNNTSLEILDCSMNQIENLNFTTNLALSSVLCSNNNLRRLNVENGNNAALTLFDTTENPNLFCITIDDAIVGAVPATWQKDDIATYNGDCENNRFTMIPDAFFEQALIDLGYDDIIDNQVLTATIEQVLTLNVSDEGISDLTGIRDFKSLVELDCSDNFLEELDVSGILFLERLNCSSNYLLTTDSNAANGVFNITDTMALTELFCAGNNLNNLDISQHLNLEVLDCADNNLSELSINTNTLLKRLNCSNNNLISLDISNNQNLEELNGDSNQLNNLNTLGITNTTLTNLSCANNDLTNLFISNYQVLTTLNASANALTELNVTSNLELSVLTVSNNQLSEINLVNNTNLVKVLAVSK